MYIRHIKSTCIRCAFSSYHHSRKDKDRGRFAPVAVILVGTEALESLLLVSRLMRHWRILVPRLAVVRNGDLSHLGKVEVVSTLLPINSCDAPRPRVASPRANTVCSECTYIDHTLSLHKHTYVGNASIRLHRLVRRR